MSKCFTCLDLREIMELLYPDEEGEKDHSEHPVTAVGVVLLSMATLGASDVGKLIHFTSYSREFISAILLNMQNNKLWIDGSYDASAWLSSDGSIDNSHFWDHIDIACGTLWIPVGNAEISADPCKIFGTNVRPLASSPRPIAAK